MPNYIMLANYTERGRRMGRSNPHLLTEAAARAETPSGRVLTLYAVLGRYDFVIIADAVDNWAAVRLSLELSSLAGVNIETLPALPIGVLSDDEHGVSALDTALELAPPEPIPAMAADGPDESGHPAAWRIPANPD